MTNRYKLQEGPDHIVWVSIQPLIEDIREKLDFYLSVPTDSFDSDGLDKLNFSILSLRSVHAFLGSLITEHTLTTMRDNNAE